MDHVKGRVGFDHERGRVGFDHERGRVGFNSLIEKIRGEFVCKRDSK